LALIDHAAIKTKSLNLILEKIFEQMNSHSLRNEQMLDALQGELFTPRIQVIGTLGDLPARNDMYHFVQGNV
jgi:hypothetical protein